MRSHLISKVLLKRFTINGQLHVYDKHLNQIFPKYPKEVAFKKYPTIKIKPLEDKWKLIEDKIPTCFTYLDNGQIIENKASINILKQFLAIHFSRSAILLDKISFSKDEFFEETLKKTYGSDFHLEVNEDLILQHKKNWDKNILEEIEPQLFESIFNKSIKYINTKDIEIVYASGENEFILSDNPVVLIDPDKNTKALHVGIKEGVGLINSNVIYMPLGPKHAVSLIDKNTNHNYLLFNNYEVEFINSLSRRQSINRVFSSPNYK